VNISCVTHPYRSFSFSEMTAMLRVMPRFSGP
jgi:hypothetical protein